MPLNSRMKIFEVLAVAVKSEIDAADVYSQLQEKVKNEILKRKLKFLAFEEQKHRQILERLFSQRFPGKKLEVPKTSILPSIKASFDESSSVLDIFRAALMAEKTSEDFYKEASQTAKEKGTRRILEYLARVERSHFFMVKSEIDLLEKFPDYYRVEEFHLGHDMVHIGP